MVESQNRQAACNFLKDFEACGVVLYCKIGSMAPASLRRADLTERNLQEAMDLIPLRPFRQALLQKLDSGEAHYSESYLLAEMMTALSDEAGHRTSTEG